MKQGFERLKEQFNENPIVVLGVIGVLLNGTAKLIEARAYSKNARTRSTRR